MVGTTPSPTGAAKTTGTNQSPINDKSKKTKRLRLLITAFIQTPQTTHMVTRKVCSILQHFLTEIERLIGSDSLPQPRYNYPCHSSTNQERRSSIGNLN
jgi:hypothetical protein